MAKKLSLLLAMVGAIAISVPASASAAPEITIKGVKAPLGSSLKGVSTNVVFKTSIGNFTCGTVEFGGEVTANPGSTFAAVAPGPMKTATCFFKGVTPITFDDSTLISLHSGTGGKGTAGLTFEMTFPEVTCHYSGSAVPFTYTTGGSSLTIKGSLVAKPAGCGTTAIEGTFALSSSEGAVVLH